MNPLGEMTEIVSSGANPSETKESILENELAKLQDRKVNILYF
jgi:hypothetical protein